MPVQTVGKVLLKHYLPSEFHSYIDSTVLDSKGISQLFEKLAHSDAGVYNKSVSGLSRLGFEVSTRQGSSISLDDLISPIDKHKEFESLNAEITKIQDSKVLPEKKNGQIFDAYTDFLKRMDKNILDEGLKKNKTLAKIILAGSRGSPAQYRSTVAAPGLVVDEKGHPLLDFPIVHSFAEGLTLPEYLAHSYGARMGEVAKKLSVADAGFFSKQLSRAAMTTRVEEHDCGTDNGLTYPVTDKDSIGAFLAHPAGGYNKNNEVTSKMLADLDNKGVTSIVVRSPATCQASKNHHFGAVCQLCVGKREKGLPSIGTYVGITAATALGEPLAQGQMNVRHGGGTASKASLASGFKLIDQLANIPKTFKGKAPLSEEDGVVHDIKPSAAGGHFITVNEKEYYVPTGLDPKVKVGDKVEAGDVLSEGIISPAEVVQFKGVGEGRKYFIDVMKKTFDDANMRVNRRNFELIAKSAIDHVRVLNPKGLGDYLPDDIVSYSALEKDYHARPDSKTVRIDLAYNKYLENPILHYTIGTRLTKKMLQDIKEHGIESVVVNDNPPQFEPHMVRLLDVPGQVPDWAHQLYSTYLERRLINAVNRGMSANLSGPSPILGLAYGVDFGKKVKSAEEGLEWVEPEIKIGEEVEVDLVYSSPTELDKEAGIKYGCLMAKLSVKDANQVVTWLKNKIKSDQLADDGYETEPHVTVLYGFHDDVTVDEIKEAVKKGMESADIEKISMTLDKVSRFENGKTKGFDVIKFGVKSTSLHWLNSFLKETFKDRWTSDYPNYNPHLTLAYVKPGACKNLDGNDVFAGKKFTFDKLVYSTAERKKTTFDL